MKRPPFISLHTWQETLKYSVRLYIPILFTALPLVVLYFAVQA